MLTGHSGDRGMLSTVSLLADDPHTGVGMVRRVMAEFNPQSPRSTPVCYPHLRDVCAQGLGQDRLFRRGEVLRQAL